MLEAHKPPGFANVKPHWGIGQPFLLGALGFYGPFAAGGIRESQDTIQKSVGLVEKPIDPFLQGVYPALQFLVISSRGGVHMRFHPVF
jgi:hypothetical protein